MTALRNVRALALLALCFSHRPGSAADLTADEQAAGFVSLFDGQSLAGWTGAVDGYTVEEGTLACQPDSGGNLFTEREFGDFVLRFDFLLTPGANNGIGLRVPAGGHASYDGMEIQLLDNTADKYATLNPYQYHGSVYGIIPAKRGYLRANGVWNTQEIRCVGRRITVVLNGETIVDGDLDEALVNGPADGKEHPGAFRTAGHIVLCGHGSDVRFRNLRIREVTAETTP